MDSTWWMTLLQTFGLPTGILIVLGFAAWRITGWLGREVIIPLRDNMIVQVIGFIGRMDACLDRLEKALTRQGALMEKFSCHAAENHIPQTSEKNHPQ